MKTLSKAISLIVAVALVVTVAFSAGAWTTDSTPALQFGSDGKFTVLQFADTQDDAVPRRAMLMLMEAAIAEVKPDLIVLTGDNTGVTDTKLASKLAIQAMLKPIVKSGIPFTMVFGNHDAEHVIKEFQLDVYQQYTSCLAVDAVPALTGCATHNLEIKSHDGTHTAFNLWMMDSNMYDEVNDSYDYVHTDQLNWYKDTEAQLKQANGGITVPSIVFQHICVPEIYEVLKDAPAGYTQLTEMYNGVPKLKEVNPAMGSGVVGEWPCPPFINGGEFNTFVETGDVVGIVTGHDHVNSFVAAYRGIDFIQTQGIGFQTYGSELRGYRVITLNESNAENPYDTYTKTFFDTYGSDTAGQFMSDYYGSETASFLPSFVGSLLIDFVSTDAGAAFYYKLKSVFVYIDELFD